MDGRQPQSSSHTKVTHRTNNFGARKMDMEQYSGPPRAETEMLLENMESNQHGDIGSVATGEFPHTIQLKHLLKHHLLEIPI